MMRAERDFKGHFIAADSCQFFRTTDVNGYRVSTIGEYKPAFPSSFTRGEFTEIGCDRLYETMVFPLTSEVCECGCGAPIVGSWHELDFHGYNDQASALAGHEAMVAKYTPTEARGA